MRALVTGCGRRLGFYLCEAGGRWLAGDGQLSQRTARAGSSAETWASNWYRRTSTREEEVGAVVTALGAPMILP